MPAMATFLAIQGNQHASGNGALPLDQGQRFADGRAGSDDIIDDQDSPGEGCANQVAAFAMGFGFLAVVGIAAIHGVVFCLSLIHISEPTRPY